MTKRKDHFTEKVEYIDVHDGTRITVHVGWKIFLIFLLSLIAISLLAAIIFYASAEEVDKHISHKEAPSVIILPIIILCGLALLSGAVIYMFKRRREKAKLVYNIASYTPIYKNLIKNNNELKVITNWSYIEQLTTKLMLEMGYNIEQSNALPLVLNFLEAKLIDSHQVDLLHELLHIRNNIVHKNYRLSPEEDIRMQRVSDEIMGTLKDLSIKRRLE